MNWMILIIFLTVSGFAFGYRDLGWGTSWIEGFLGGFAGLFIGGIIATLGTSYSVENINYEISSEQTYTIKEIEENKYFETLNETGISVFILQDNKHYIKEAYPQDKVIFTEGETASVTIIKEKAVSVDFLGETSIENLKRDWWMEIPDEERIKEVIITIPNKSENATANNTIENDLSAELQTNSYYCTECGEKITEKWKYCGNCGHQLNKDK